MRVNWSEGQDTARASTAPIEHPSVNRCEGQDDPGTTGTYILTVGVEIGGTLTEAVTQEAGFA